jgi:hypothetical protein
MKLLADLGFVLTALLVTALARITLGIFGNDPVASLLVPVVRIFT